MIQFIVISKGSERVAEVAARFTLDAMPGKQMSIDAELRAGHIDHNEARRRRAALARESQLFGSMDGAMKFVKGDAIAGIVVLAVNIVGGLVIGVAAARAWTSATAARTYTVLTIGEGLVAQIPALVISTSAGIIVTRVASEEEGGHLGRDIGLQVMAQPKAIAIAAGLLAAAGDRAGAAGRPVPHAGRRAGRWSPGGCCARRRPRPARRRSRRGRRGGVAAARAAGRARGRARARAGADADRRRGRRPSWARWLGPRGPGDAGPFATEVVPRCASGCSPSWGCRCRRCGCGPAWPGWRRPRSSSA